jgi:hypothetical protein
LDINILGFDHSFLPLARSVKPASGPHIVLRLSSNSLLPFGPDSVGARLLHTES